jgi:CheY-like chemotaxis protein
VLVVEDDEPLRNVIADVLQEHEFRVVTAANGSDALDQLDTLAPDLMVVDLLMPVMHGWDFIETYPEKTGGKSIPIVVVSVNAALPRSFNRLGVRDVVAKPFAIDQLLEAVDGALEPVSA